VFLCRMDGGFCCVDCVVGGGLFVGWVVRAFLCPPRDDDDDDDGGDLDGNRLPVVLLGGDGSGSCLVCASLYPTS